MWVGGDDMGKRLYLSGEVAKIVGIDPRKVLSRYERGMVNPFQQSTGTGSWNKFDEVNVLEYKLSETLFSIGMGFKGVKLMLNILEVSGFLREWADNFKDHYKNETDRLRSEMGAWLLDIKEMKGNHETSQKSWDRMWAKFQEFPEPTKPVGVLAYFFREGKKFPDVRIYPWDKGHIIELTEIKDDFIKGGVSVLIDIGEIKDEIDQRL